MVTTYKLKRPIQKIIRFSEAENDYIMKKVEKSEFKNFQNFARIMLIKGEVKTIDYSELFYLNQQLSKIGNNINQVVRLAHQFDEISTEDISNLQIQMQEIKDMVREKINEEMKEGRKM